MRLRNNSVAILTSDSYSPKLLAKSISKTLRRRANFSCFNGFTDSRKPAGKVIPLALASVLALIFVTSSLGNSNTERETKATKLSCVVQNLIGVEIKPVELNAKTIKIKGQNYSINSRRAFGGMVELTAQKTCDENTYLLRLWSIGDRYVVSEVN